MDAAMFTPERDGQSLGQLVLRKRPPVVFQDLDGNLDTGLGGDQLTELALVVILYQYDRDWRRPILPTLLLPETGAAAGSAKS